LQGYRFCVEACPYKKIYYNHLRDIAQKCIFCYPRTEKGVAPACARQCPGRLRFIGFLDEKDGRSTSWSTSGMWLSPCTRKREPNHTCSTSRRSRRRASTRTATSTKSKPRIPTRYLQYLFGDGVVAALETLKAEMAKTKAPEVELMDLLIVYEWRSLFGPFTQDPAQLAPRKA